MTDRRAMLDGFPTRRRFLVTAAVTATAPALAGCAGGDEADPGDQESGQPLDPPVLGDPDAAVTVVAYEDFGCGGCGYYHGRVLPELKAEFADPGSIRYEHHDFVIPAAGETSWEAASAARAVQDRAGDEAFWVYAGRIFANQADLSTDLLGTLAEDLDVDASAIREAGANQTYYETVKHYHDGGVDRGISATPTVVVDSTPVEWEQISYEPVRAEISAAVQS